MTPLMCPKCRNVHVEYYRVVDLAECQDCFHRFHLRRRPSTVPRPDVIVSIRADAESDAA